MKSHRKEKSEGRRGENTRVHTTQHTTIESPNKILPPPQITNNRIRRFVGGEKISCHC
jgi:hypothetical protein